MDSPDLADSAPSLLMEVKTHTSLLVQLCWQSVWITRQCTKTDFGFYWLVGFSPLGSVSFAPIVSVALIRLRISLDPPLGLNISITETALDWQLIGIWQHVPKDSTGRKWMSKTDVYDYNMFSSSLWCCGFRVWFEPKKLKSDIKF